MPGLKNGALDPLPETSSLTACLLGKISTCVPALQLHVYKLKEMITEWRLDC